MKKPAADARKQTGKLGEAIAAVYLQKEQYTFIARNWRCKSGEIDLIAEKDGVLVFVEVRTRRQTGTYGTAKESVDFRKQKQVRETANVYLHLHKQTERKIRFDVISVELAKDGSFTGLEHLTGAF
jgi:putative endonuclease